MPTSKLVPRKTPARSNHVARRLAAGELLKLDIACGANKQGAEWIGIDHQALPGVDVVHDIETYPWPFADAVFSLAVGSHIAEHIDPAHGGFLRWMDEIWRVLKIGGQLMLALPYGGSPGFWQDPTHCNGCNENTWIYFDPLHPSGFYKFYRPRPWELMSCTWDGQGFMDVAMKKRRLDRSYLK
ncbi:MAG: hypothetical protein NVS9B2_29430 [Steroidobacteraceae bacterium]